MKNGFRKSICGVYHLIPSFRKPQSPPAAENLEKRMHNWIPDLVRSSGLVRYDDQSFFRGPVSTPAQEAVTRIIEIYFKNINTQADT